jgi:maltooligosyltrehalose synthase
MKKELEGNKPDMPAGHGFIPGDMERSKFLYTWTGLRFRRRHKELFVGGEYLPVAVRGNRERNVVAFIRKRGKKIALVAAGRFFTQWPAGKSLKIQSDFWGNTELVLPEDPEFPARLRDIVTSGAVDIVKRKQYSSIRASDIFRRACACIFTNEEDRG